MINVAVVDHLESRRAALVSILREFERENDNKIEVFEFSSSSEILNSMGIGFGLALIEHDATSSYNGLGIADQIRILSRETLIVFLSSKADQWEDGFKVSAFNYLVRPVSKAKLKLVLAEALQRINEIRKTVLITTDKSFIALPSQDIICFCKCGNRQTYVYYFKSGKMINAKIRADLSAIEEQLLPLGFVRSQGNCIANPIHVRKVWVEANKTCVKTSLGEEIVIMQRTMGMCLLRNKKL
ncbi:MAG: LytR/AlgR family response regulator transcription factor [Eubacteriales bacterium]|jgi:DNA-binding LytR/AlgR family response regulator